MSDHQGLQQFLAHMASQAGTAPAAPAAPATGALLSNRAPGGHAGNIQGVLQRILGGNMPMRPQGQERMSPEVHGGVPNYTGEGYGQNYTGAAH